MTSDMVGRPNLSIVVPVYNSENSLPALIAELAEVLPVLCEDYEAILVNDGSRDQSWDVVCRLTREYAWVHGINLMRNYGQHNALLCGIRQAQHPVIITMDDDLQHPPSEIAKLLDKLAEGYDVVYGIPHKLPHSLWRNLFSKFTKRAMAQAMGIRNIRDISAFRALRRDLRKAFVNYASPHLLLDVLLSWGTTRFAAVEVRHEPRRIGQSNYNFIKLFNQAMLILTGFSTGPLRLASLVGFGCTLFGLVVLVYVVGRFVIQGGSVPGFPFLASVIAIFSGAQLFAVGIIGEYLGRVFYRSLERPTYVVDQVAEPAEEIEGLDVC